MKSIIIQETKRIGYEGKYYLIIPDHAAGKQKRFTLYKVPTSPSRRIKIIGRELPLGYCKKLAKKDFEEEKIRYETR